MLHQRKVRLEQTEKQQAAALERMQRLVEESSATLPRADALAAHDDGEICAVPYGNGHCYMEQTEEQ